MDLLEDLVNENRLIKKMHFRTHFRTIGRLENNTLHYEME
jgi:hypothetical protein